MSNKVHINLSIDRKIRDMAKSKGLNISQICEEALKKALSVSGSIEQLEQQRAAKVAEMQYIDNEINFQKQVQAIKANTIKDDEETINNVINILETLAKVAGRLGKDRIALVCEQHNVDEMQVLIKLPDNIKQNLVDVHPIPP